MVIQTMTLDPNAQAYTNDEIVGKVNSATAQLTRVDAIAGEALGDCDTDDLTQGAVNIYRGEEEFLTAEKTKLTGIEALAEVNVGEEFLTAEKSKLTGIEADAKDDQTGPEVRDLIVAIADVDRQLVVTAPSTGEFKIVAMQRDATGKLDIDYDDVPES